MGSREVRQVGEGSQEMVSFQAGYHSNKYLVTYQALNTECVSCLRPT